MDENPEANHDLLKEMNRMGNKTIGNEAVASMAKKIYSDRVPVRLDSDGQRFAIPVRREFLRTLPQHAFSSPRPYTVFGRVESRVKRNESWEPGDMFRTLQALSTGDPASSFSEAIRDIADGKDIEMNDLHMELQGPAKVVHPIAIWW